MNFPAKKERPLVTIIDLEIQNILSVENAFRVVGADVRIIKTTRELDGSGFVVLPGVGAFGTAAARLKETGMGIALRHHALELRLPLMGLCLGMQLLADTSEEYGLNDGLGLIPGKVVQLQDMPPEFRVPNIGWREVKSTGNSDLLPQLVKQNSYYHVHSYHFQCADSADIAGFTRFGDGDIVSVVHRANVFGTQFHPEKSQDAGLDMLHTVLHFLT